MKVHIVAREIDQDRILTRLANYLAAENGWTLGTSPRDDVDFNLFDVYINFAERWHDWHRTPIGAYFSHYEEGATQKEFWWTEAAQRVDLAIVTADRYAEMVQGVKVTPPVDPQFSPGASARAGQVAVGVAGYVPRRGGDRKGVKLLEWIMKAKPEYGWTATGDNWPIASVVRGWKAMPPWYRGLDVFLCTSQIEGIPMPPLEALACGTPVVVPEGVGMLDELDGAGVFHYARGHEGLRRALDEAVAYRRGQEYDAKAVAANVAHMTPAAFAADVKRAILERTYPVTAEESSRHGKRGIYTVAYGAQARKCASHLIDTIRHWLPDVEVAVASDSALNGEDYLVRLPDVDIGGRAAKTQIADVVPDDWQYVLYLDADTEVVKDISFLFDALEQGWDFVICRNPGKYHTIRKMVRIDNKDECEFTFRQLGTDELIQLNGGVFAFQRNARTLAFLRSWHQEWQKWGKRDQAALLRALFKNPMRMYVLGNEWNTIVRYVDNPMEYTAGILHHVMTARRWRGIVDGRLDSKEAWAATKSFR